ncbi:hypothetical protein [Kordiimonas sp.]|uniref:hypothetical protein n=1 Tax=Kordiimonas sp. TaxID=1970157 RepID=UPI003A8D20A6
MNNIKVAVLAGIIGAVTPLALIGPTGYAITSKSLVDELEQRAFQAPTDIKLTALVELYGDDPVFDRFSPTLYTISPVFEFTPDVIENICVIGAGLDQNGSESMSLAINLKDLEKFSILLEDEELIGDENNAASLGFLQLAHGYSTRVARFRHPLSAGNGNTPFYVQVAEPDMSTLLRSLAELNPADEIGFCDEDDPRGVSIYERRKPLLTKIKLPQDQN